VRAHGCGGRGGACDACTASSFRRPPSPRTRRPCTRVPRTRAGRPRAPPPGAGESRSLKAAYELLENGWSAGNIRHLDGGFQQWRFQGLPVETDSD
jgi:hypothetical protein